MTTVLEPTNSFATAFERTPGHTHPWVNGLRARGMNTFRRLGFPTTSQEQWRDTNVALLARTEFAPAKLVTGSAAIDLAREFSFGSEAAAELVFVNGHFDPHLSTLSALPRGVRAISLERAMESDQSLLQAHLGRYAQIDQHPFAALNTGFLRDGALVHVARNAHCQRPIHLLFLTVPPAASGEASAAPADSPGTAAASHPRVLVVAEENSESSIVETYAAAQNAAPLYLTNAVTEIHLGRGARIDHNKLQQEAMSGYHIALQHVVLEAESLFVSHSTSLGSKLTRNDLHVLLHGERAEATLNGLVLARDHQHIDNHTLLQHEKGHCPSHELYKHVLDDDATAIFKGKIFVQHNAQKTDAKQTTKSLLLSNRALMNSQPALEIYADDVKCTHGSTTGPVDENAVFYLISRGLSLAQARHLMTYAFAADITRRIRVAPVRTRIEDFMAAQHGLPQDLRIADEARHDVALL